MTTTKAKATTEDEIEILSSEPTPLTLVSGFEINIERLKTRALMSLLKILTFGAADALMSLRVDEGTSEEEFAGNLIGAVLLAIPEAENETIEFLNRMVTPAGLRKSRTAEDIEFNANLEFQLQDELQDPELTDLLTIVTEIVRKEAPHIQALGKQIRVLWPMATKSASKKPPKSSKKSVKE